MTKAENFLLLTANWSENLKCKAYAWLHLGAYEKIREKLQDGTYDFSFCAGESAGKHARNDRCAFCHDGLHLLPPVQEWLRGKEDALKEDGCWEA